MLTCLLSAEAPPHPTAAPGKGTWSGLPEAELKLIWTTPASEEPTDICKTKSSKKNVGVASPGGWEEESSHAPPTEGVCSKKQSAVHDAVIKSRDETFQVRYIAVCFCAKIGSFWKPFATNYSTLPSLAETTLLFYRVTI